MDKGNRLMSLDALRGFDMFFITGGAALISAVVNLFGFGDGWLARQMVHVPWAGLTHHDTIFPLFLFLAGATWLFSLAAQRAKGRTSGQIYRKIIVGGPWGSVGTAVTYCMVVWALLYFLYRKEIFLKV